MAKKTSKKKTSTRQIPQPAQLKAVDRLLDDEDYAGAISKISELLKRFPDHGGLWRALIEARELGKGPQSAALAAYQWAEHRPNSLQAQETLLEFARRRGLLLLADQVARKVRMLGGDTPGFPIPSGVLQDLLKAPEGAGRVTPDVMERLDIGRLHLDAQDFEGTLHWLEGLDFTPARNNRGVALFHQEHIQEALDTFLANWERDPDNLFALGWAIQLRLYLGDETGAMGLATPMATAKSRRLEDAVFQMEALLLLQQDQNAWDCFERARRSDWYPDGEGRLEALLRHFGACAASRLGKDKTAGNLWREAAEHDPSFTPPKENLERLDTERKAPRFPAIMDFTQALPMNCLKRIQAQKDRSPSAIDRIALSNAYLKHLYLAGDHSLRTITGILLRRHTELGDKQAAEFLKEFAALPIGTPSERLEFLHFLRDQGLQGRDELVPYWDGEQIREIKVFTMQISREPEDIGLPPDLQSALEQSILLFRERRFDEAEKYLNKILQRLPEHRVALGNLAAIRSTQGRGKEARALLERVVDRHPDYLTARCNLAQMQISAGEFEAANALLAGLGDRDHMHIQDLFYLHGALARLHAAKGETEEAQHLIANLERFVEDEDDEQRLKQIKRSVESASSMGTSHTALSRLVSKMKS